MELVPYVVSFRLWLLFVSLSLFWGGGDVYFFGEAYNCRALFKSRDVLWNGERILINLSLDLFLGFRLFETL